MAHFGHEHARTHARGTCTVRARTGQKRYVHVENLYVHVDSFHVHVPLKSRVHARASRLINSRVHARKKGRDCAQSREFLCAHEASGWRNQCACLLGRLFLVKTQGVTLCSFWSEFDVVLSKCTVFTLTWLLWSLLCVYIIYPIKFKWASRFACKLQLHDDTSGFIVYITDVEDRLDC